MTEAQTRWHAVADAADLRQEATARIAAAARDAVNRRGAFSIVLAGGRTPQQTYRALAEMDLGWEGWHVYFGDERCLPAGNGGRNDRFAAEILLSRVPIPPVQVHPIAAERGPVAGAASYAAILSEVGLFDLVLLGLGEDGHTAGLFPGHALGAEPGSADVLPVRDAPKPPPERVTLSSARLSRARAVLFLVEGNSKREAVARWRAGAAIPAAAIRPASGVDVLVTQPLLA